MILQRVADLPPNIQVDTLFSLAQTGTCLILRKGLAWPVTSLVNSQAGCFQLEITSFSLCPFCINTYFPPEPNHSMSEPERTAEVLLASCFILHVRAEAQRGQDEAPDHFPEGSPVISN